MSNETQLRIIQELQNVPEHSFYSEAVQTVIDEISNIKTLKDLIQKSSHEDRNRINDVFNLDMRRDAVKYDLFVERIGKLENTFSYDVDYI